MILWRPTRLSSSVQFSLSVVSDSLWPHGLQHTRLPCPSQTLRAYTQKKDIHSRDRNAKVRSQETPGVMGIFVLGVQNEAGQRLTEFCQENALVTANTLFQQNERWLYTWTSPAGQCWNQLDCILCSQRWTSSIQSTYCVRTAITRLSSCLLPSPPASFNGPGGPSPGASAVLL